MKPINVSLLCPRDNNQNKPVAIPPRVSLRGNNPIKAVAISNTLFAALLSLTCACNFIYDYPNNIGPSDTDTDDGTGADTDAQQDPTGEDIAADDDKIDQPDAPDGAEDAQDGADTTDAADTEEEEEPPPENYTWDITATGGEVAAREYALLVPLWLYQQESDLIMEHAVTCIHLDAVAADSCGSNDGTVFGLTESYPSVPQSDFGRSFYFDGDDKITLNDGDALDGWTGLTVGAWVMLESECRVEKTIFSWDSPAGGSGKMSCVDTDHAYWRILGETGEGGIVDVDNVFIDFGRWYHVVGRFDGSTSRLYVDGQLIGSAGFEDTIDNEGEIGIGVNVNGGAAHADFWTGKIDEVVIFDYALGDYEIAHMHADDCWKFDVAFPYYLDFYDGTALLSEEAIETDNRNQWELDIDDAVLYYRCNGDFANEAGDPDGTAMGGASADADSLPDLQNACAFDGDGDMVDTGYHTAENTNNFTVCLFASREDWDAPGHAYIAGEHDGASGEWLLRIKDNSQLQFFGDDPENDPKVNLSELKDGTMHYICGVSDDPKKSLYVDGVLVDSFDNDWNMSSGYTLRLGGAPACDANPTWAFDGRIDEARLWTRPRSAEEIRSDLAPDFMRVWYTDISGLETEVRTTGAFYAHDDFGLAADYWFNEGGGTILHDFDRVGDYRDHGVIEGATWSTDVPNDCFDYSLLFNGVDSYVDLGFKPSISAFSFAAWVNFSDIESDQRGIFTTMQDDSNRDGFFFAHHNVSGWTLSGYDNNEGVSTCQEEAVSATTDTWYHVAATYDGANPRIYVNSSPITCGEELTGAIDEHDENVFIGENYHEYGSRFMNGLITGAKFWDSVLTEAQIQALYNGGECLRFSVSDPMPL